MPVIRQFFKNWGHFSLEVNALNALSYHTHLPFFVHHFDLLAPFCVADTDHSDMMEEVLDRYALTEEAQRQVLEGAKDSLAFDRAFRGSIAVVLEIIAE